MEERRYQQAKKVYANICKFLDKNNWKYSKDEEKLSISSSASGDDLPIDARIIVDARLQLVMLYSQLPFYIQENKRAEAAVAICTINYGLGDGSFDYDVTNGAVIFRLTSSFLESLLGENLFGYMIQATMSVVDHYNDKLLMYSKGMLTLKQLVDPS